MLRHAVTFISDPLTLNVCNVAAVTWSTAVPIWAKVDSPQRRYCDISMSNLEAVRHFGFERKWIFTIPRPDHNATSLSNVNTIG